MLQNLFLSASASAESWTFDSNVVKNVIDVFTGAFTPQNFATVCALIVGAGVGFIITRWLINYGVSKIVAIIKKGRIRL